MNDKLKELKAKTLIEIPPSKLPDLIRFTYLISKPVGMGFLHYTPGDIPEETLNSILHDRGGIHMDYVHGRQCKMSVLQEDGKYFIRKKWPDHDDEDMNKLLTLLELPIQEDLQ